MYPASLAERTNWCGERDRLSLLAVLTLLFPLFRLPFKEGADPESVHPHPGLQDGPCGGPVQVPSEANEVQAPDPPLGGVPVVPGDATPVVAREGVVEVVVASSK